LDIDQLIITLVEAGRQASEEELDHIIEHVARAPFASHPRDKQMAREAREFLPLPPFAFGTNLGYNGS